MSYEISWLVDKRVLYVSFKGNVTQADLEKFVIDVENHVRGGTPLVHMITNSLEMGKVEFSLSMLQTLTKTLKITRLMGWTIDVNRSPINKMIASIGSQFAGVRFRIFATLDDAIAFLRNNDTTLADMQWEGNTKT